MSDNGLVNIAIKLLHPKARLPEYMSLLAAGADLYPALDEPITIAPGTTALVPCGFAMAIPAGYEGQVRPRSGLALKAHLTIPNSPGTIEADYRGEVKVILHNFGTEQFVVENAMRIAQLVIAPVMHAVFVKSENLDDTARGTGGFGTTGVN